MDLQYVRRQLCIADEIEYLEFKVSLLGIIRTLKKKLKTNYEVKVPQSTSSFTSINYRYFNLDLALGL